MRGRRLGGARGEARGLTGGGAADADCRACTVRPPAGGWCIGEFLDPPVADEKRQVQALARSQPAFPMMPGMCERRTHEYLRHGTTSLFAAFNTPTER